MTFSDNTTNSMHSTWLVRLSQHNRFRVYSLQSNGPEGLEFLVILQKKCICSMRKRNQLLFLPLQQCMVMQLPDLNTLLLPFNAKKVDYKE